MKIIYTPFSRTYYLDAARRVVKTTGSSDQDLLAACETLRAWGDWQDHQMADVVEKSVRYQLDLLKSQDEIDAELTVGWYKLSMWLTAGIAAWAVLAFAVIAVKQLIETL